MSRSYRLFTLVIVIVISAIFATLATIPGLARAQDATFCYSDGCVTLPVGPNGNPLARQSTSASGLMSAINARNVSLYGTSDRQNDSSGNLTYVACNNGVTASAVYKKPAPAATYPPPPPPPPTCSIKFINNPIPADSSTVMRWSSTNAELFYINGFGYVGASGKVTVAPSQSTDYTGHVSNSEDDGEAVNCSATLVVLPRECPPGQTLVNGICVTPSCPTGYIRQGNECVLPVCTTPPDCEGDNLINSCTDALIRTCDWGCAAGACKAIPAPSATLKAAPSLVHSGAVTTISWTASNVTSCTVRGANGDSWTGISSVGKTTSLILGQTIYTLHCTGYAGANPASIDKTVTVNLIPNFNEK